ncbi:MAG TPA: Wzt carbohydrate-binding domain-containing protein [Bryobacteraceae bacterium]|nr:Wzt carbohydrate-binding domain-containing protein [Bryobacteraceae bacterium]
MSIEFCGVSIGPLKDFTATAPAGAIIGLIGGKNSGVAELLKVAGGALEPSSGEIVADGHRRYVALGEPLNLAPAAVLALDQVLATQDALVRARTLPGLDRLRRSGSTVLLASHEEHLLEALCDEIWWLEAGELAARGDARETLSRYRRAIAEQVRAWGETIPPRLAPSFRRGDGRAEVIALETLGTNGQPTIVWKSGEYVSVRATVRFHEAVAEPVIGMIVRTQIGFEVYGTSTEAERVAIGPRKAGESVSVVFAFLCDLCPQAYTLTLYSQDPDGSVHDWLDDAVAFTVTDERATLGVANLRAKVTIEAPPAS